MRTHLRLDRRDPSGWTLAEGPHTIGWIVPGRLAITGFADTATATVAAASAARVLAEWSVARAHLPRGNDQSVRITVDGTGFQCDIPDDTWPAVLLELAQRVHLATLALRHPLMEPVA